MCTPAGLQSAGARSHVARRRGRRPRALSTRHRSTRRGMCPASTRTARLRRGGATETRRRDERSDHGVIDRHEVLGLERFQQIGCGGGQRNRCHVRSVAARTASVSRRNQRSCGRPNRRESRPPRRPITSYGGALRACESVHLSTVRRKSRLRAPQAGLTSTSAPTAPHAIRRGSVQERRP
jgi:hypothetical protein